MQEWTEIPVIIDENLDLNPPPKNPVNISVLEKKSSFLTYDDTFLSNPDAVAVTQPARKPAPVTSARRLIRSFFFQQHEVDLKLATLLRTCLVLRRQKSRSNEREAF